MFKVLTVAFGLSSVALAFSSFYLWGELQDARNTRPSEIAVPAAASSFAEDAPRPGARLSPVAAASVTEATPPLPVPKSTGASSALTAQLTRDDPEFRAQRHAIEKRWLAGTHAHSVRWLGLSRLETDMLFDLLADVEIEPTAEFNYPLSAEDQAAQRQAVDAKNRKIAERIARKFGDDKAQAWTDYASNNRAQSRVRNFSSLLDTYQLPLKDEQRRALATIFQRHEALLPDASQFDRDRERTDLPYRIAAYEQRLAAYAEFERKVVDDAVSYLSREQLALLGSEIANTSHMINMQLTLARKDPALTK